MGASYTDEMAGLAVEAFRSRFAHLPIRDRVRLKMGAHWPSADTCYVVTYEAPVGRLPTEMMIASCSVATWPAKRARMLAEAERLAAAWDANPTIKGVPVEHGVEAFTAARDMRAAA